MTSTRLQLFLLALGTANVAIMLELVRRRRLREKFALLWMAVGVGGLILSVQRGVIDRLARAVGVSYGPTILFMGATLFLLFVCVQLSVEVSRLNDRTTRLAQEVGLLRAERQELL